MAIPAHSNPAVNDSAALAKPRAQAIQAALLAAIVGGLLIFVTGFAHPQAIHNGTHDTRHGLSFPCH